MSDIFVDPDLPVRELLRRSQTDVTDDPELGYRYADAAYYAIDSEVRVLDPLAEGEAAAKAGFRAEQTGRTMAISQAWFERSFAALSGSDPESQRERVATSMLAVRTLALRGLRQQRLAKPDVREMRRLWVDGQLTLDRQHRPDGPWDRYGTMLDRHAATGEAMFGSAMMAAGLSLQGVYRAVRAEREEKPLEEHRAFIAKHAGANAVAGVLALTRPLAGFPVVQSRRQQLAQKLVG